MDRLPLHEQARLLDDYGWELHIAHRFPAALAAARDAVDRYERVGDPVPLGEAVVRLSRHVYMDGDTDGAEQLVQRAVDILRAAGQAEALAAAATSRGALLTLTGRLAEAVPALEDALRLARAAARPEQESLCLNYLGLARAERGGGAGEAELREALAVAQAAGCHEAAARAHLNLADLLHALGRWADFDVAVTAGQVFTREHGLWQHAFVMELHRHMLLVHRGEWDTAEQGLRQLVEQADPGMLDVHRLHPYGRLLARRGRPQARELLENAWDQAVLQRAPLGLARAGIGLVELAWLTGRPDRARHVGDALLPRMREPGWAYMRGELTCYLALAGVPPDPLPECAEPWAAGLRGDWRAAAAGWERERAPLRTGARARRVRARRADARGAACARRAGRDGARRGRASPAARARGDPAAPAVGRTRPRRAHPSRARGAGAGGGGRHERGHRRSAGPVRPDGRPPCLGDPQQARRAVASGGCGHRALAVGRHFSVAATDAPAWARA